MARLLLLAVLVGAVGCAADRSAQSSSVSSAPSQTGVVPAGGVATTSTPAEVQPVGAYSSFTPTGGKFR